VVDLPAPAGFERWLRQLGIEGQRRVARSTDGVVLVSKFEAGFAARLYDALDRVPELFDEVRVAALYTSALPETTRVEAWRLAINALLAELGPQRGLDPDQLAEIRAGTDSVAALLDSVLWTCPVVGSDWEPSAAELEAKADAEARMDEESSIFTRYYGEFEGRRVENHCPGAPVARRLFAQAWAIAAAGTSSRSGQSVAADGLRQERTGTDPDYGRRGNSTPDTFRP
jgi:hypothetical protein